MQDNLNINAHIIVIVVTYIEVDTEQTKRQSTSEPINIWFDLYGYKCSLSKQIYSLECHFHFYLCQTAYTRFKSFSYFNRHGFDQPIITIIIRYYVLPVSICRIQPLWIKTQNPKLKHVRMHWVLYLRLAYCEK
jgi:hypothetical protein